MKISKTKISTNNTVFIVNYKFNQYKNCFILSDKNKHEILDILPKLKLDDEYKLKDYDVFLCTMLEKIVQNLAFFKFM